MDTAKKTATHGGARSNSGIKPADGVKGVKRVNITIDAKSDAIAKEIGEGDRSLGIRRALAIAHDQITGRNTQQVRTANNKPKKETP